MFSFVIRLGCECGFVYFKVCFSYCILYFFSGYGYILIDFVKEVCLEYWVYWFLVKLVLGNGNEVSRKMFYSWLFCEGRKRENLDLVFGISVW